MIHIKIFICYFYFKLFELLPVRIWILYSYLNRTRWYMNCVIVRIVCRVEIFRCNMHNMHVHTIWNVYACTTSFTLLHHSECTDGRPRSLHSCQCNAMRSKKKPNLIEFFGLGRSQPHPCSIIKMLILQTLTNINKPHREWEKKHQFLLWMNICSERLLLVQVLLWWPAFFCVFLNIIFSTFPTARLLIYKFSVLFGFL